MNFEGSVFGPILTIESVCTIMLRFKPQIARTGMCILLHIVRCLVGCFSLVWFIFWKGGDTNFLFF